MTIDVAFGKAANLYGQGFNPALSANGARDSRRSAAAGAWTAQGSAADDTIIVVKANVSAWILFGTGTALATPPAAPSGSELNVWPIAADGDP